MSQPDPIDRREVTPNFKVPAQCGCSANKRAKPDHNCQSSASATKNKTGKGLQRNSSLKSSGPIKWTGKRTKLRPGQLKEGSPEWEAERQKAKDRSRGSCEAKKGSVCREQAEHLHHIHLRKQGGSDYAENLLNICNPCHDWIHKHVKEARENGWLKHSWEGEEVITKMGNPRAVLEQSITEKDFQSLVVDARQLHARRNLSTLFVFQKGKG